VADDDRSQDLSDDTARRDDELTDSLSVAALAEELGTNSQQVLDALTALDGETRTPDAHVDPNLAQRVRDALAAQKTQPPQADGAGTVPDASRPEYMPLFVAPPSFESGSTARDADDYGQDSGAGDEPRERPAHRRRRRGRRDPGANRRTHAAPHAGRTRRRNDRNRCRRERADHPRRRPGPVARSSAWAERTDRRAGRPRCR